MFVKAKDTLVNMDNIVSVVVEYGGSGVRDRLRFSSRDGMKYVEVYTSNGRKTFEDFTNQILMIEEKKLNKDNHVIILNQYLNEEKV